MPQGTTVCWTNDGQTTHTSTSDTGVWDSSFLAPGESFSFTFNNTGSFPYHCTIHAAQMTGTITVTEPPPGWQIRASMPVDQYGGAADSDGTVAFVAGGYSFQVDALNTLYKFNPSTNTWTQLTSMPDANIMASGVYYPPANKLYVFGGEDPESGQNFNNTRIYDIASDTWTTGAPMPDVRSFAASGYNPGNGKIYVVAGYNTGTVDSAQDTTWEYDPVANTWTVKAPLPHAVGGPGFGIVDGHMYVAGGRDATNTVINLCWDYDIAANSWSACSNLPSANNVPGSGVATGRCTCSAAATRSWWVDG